MELTVFDEQCGTCSSKHALLKRLADENGTSIKVAKYSGTNRIDLIENNEYGYCSLIKATPKCSEQKTIIELRLLSTQ